jgi:cytochrome c-type biogenesis protein CcmH
MVWMLCIGSVLSVPLAQAIDPVELEDPVLQERYRALSHELRCMQCQNQSIADSPVGLAGDLRREVRELLLQGKTDDEVREHLRARYGDFILFRPDFNARTAWLWLAPGLMLILGLVVAWRVIRRRAAMLPMDPSPADASQTDASQTDDTR